MNRKTAICSAAAILAIALFAVLWNVCAPGETETPEAPRKAKKTAQRAPKADRRPAQAKSGSFGRPKKTSPDLSQPLDDFEKSLSGKDRAVYIPLRRALDGEDLENVVKYAALAADSPNEEIRQYAVEALSWFEEKAVVEMLPFLMDPSESVATDAKRRFTDILDGMEDEDEKLKIVSSVMKKLKTGDLLDEMANRIVLTQSSGKAVKTLSDLIFYGSTDVRKKAMDTYREVTGEIYPGREKALEWAKNNMQE